VAKRLTKKDFIRKAQMLHGNKYDYSLVDYKTSKTNVKIICNKHGLFEQSPSNHMRGQNCPLCANAVRNKNNKSTAEIFIKKAKKIHKDKYGYDLVKYNKMTEKVKIICLKHGEFLQTPANHIHTRGCPKCCESKGEEKIRMCLENLNLEYERQKTFIGCSNIRLLPFDFYLPQKKMLIEYDGEQHFKPVNFFGGKKTYLLLKHNDNIKNSFVVKNDVSLLRIPYYKQDYIEEILNNII